MLFRLIFFAFVIAGGWTLWSKWRGPKLLRVPFVWKSMSRRHHDLRDAIRTRTAIGQLLLKGPRPRTEAILAEVDRVIEALVTLAKTREARGGDGGPDDASHGALSELDALYNQIKAESYDRTEDALDRVRERLADCTNELRNSTQVRRELTDREP